MNGACSILYEYMRVCTMAIFQREKFIRHRIYDTASFVLVIIIFFFHFFLFFYPVLNVDTSSMATNIITIYPNLLTILRKWASNEKKNENIFSFISMSSRIKPNKYFSQFKSKFKSYVYIFKFPFEIFFLVSDLVLVSNKQIWISSLESSPNSNTRTSSRRQLHSHIRIKRQNQRRKIPTTKNVSIFPSRLIRNYKIHITNERKKETNTNSGKKIGISANVCNFLRRRLRRKPKNREKRSARHVDIDKFNNIKNAYKREDKKIHSIGCNTRRMMEMKGSSRNRKVNQKKRPKEKIDRDLLPNIVRRRRDIFDGKNFSTD